MTSEKPENNKSGTEIEKADEDFDAEYLSVPPMADAPTGETLVPLEPMERLTDPVLEYKTRKNKLQLFPQGIRDQLDVLIHSGRGGGVILSYLKRNYRGPLEIPSLATCVKYVTLRRNALGGEQGKLQIQRILSKKMDFTTIPKNDKRAMLQAVIEFMAWRIEQVKLITEHLKSPQYERIITDDTRVILETITKQIALEKEFGINAERVRVVLSVLLRHMGVRVQQAYMDVNGNNKIDQFVARLGELMDELDLDTIEQEATEAFDKSEDRGAK